MRGRLDVVDKAIRKCRTSINITVSGIMPYNDANREKKTGLEKIEEQKIRMSWHAVICGCENYNTDLYYFQNI